MKSKCWLSGAVKYLIIINSVIFQLSEIMFFMLVMLVFLVSYGVVSQALMFPNRKPYPLFIKDLVYMPYWQIYGELFLEDMSKLHQYYPLVTNAFHLTCTK